MISRRVIRAKQLTSEQTQTFNEPCWSIGELSGRVCELQPDSSQTQAAESNTTSSALLTAAVRLMVQSQQRGDPAVWISAGPHLFFPPDLQANGVDLDAVVVVRLTDAPSAAQAADQLVRSGSFGIVVIDLVGFSALIPDAIIGRLSGLARTHDTAVLFLCDHTEQSRLGSIISLRAQVRSRAASDGRYSMEITVTKDKKRGRSWRWTEGGNGPPGLP